MVSKIQTPKYPNNNNNQPKLAISTNHVNNSNHSSSSLHLPYFTPTNQIPPAPQSVQSPLLQQQPSQSPQPQQNGNTTAVAVTQPVQQRLPPTATVNHSPQSPSSVTPSPSPPISALPLSNMNGNGPGN